MPEAHRWNASHERYLSALVLAIAILIFTLVELRISSPNRDNTWLLEIARRMMDGGKYYVDFFELNPPLYPVLLMPVEFLSAHTGLSQFICFNAFIAFLVYMSCYANYFLISRVFGINFSSHISLSIALAAILFFSPGSEFGQRDHVAIVLILPSLTWFAVRNDDRRLTPFSMALVTCAALGFMIKPYLLAVGIAVYALRIITDRTIRVLIDPPILIVAVSSIVYVICIWYMFPEYFAVMRLAGQYYSAYNTAHVFDNLSIGGAAAILIISIFNECIHESAATLRFSRILSAAACGAVFSYVIQRKGFPYHFIPAKLVILLLFAVAIVSACRLVRAWAGGLLFRCRCVLAALAICVALLRAVGWTALAAHRQDVVMRQFAQSLTNLNAGKRLFFSRPGCFLNTR